MPLFTGLLISTKRNFESSASSEIQFTLIEKLGIPKNNIRVKKTGISGLITVQVNEYDSTCIIEKLIKLEVESNYFIHCLKIRPIQIVAKLNSEDGLENIQQIIRDKFLSEDKTSSYKIVIVKRHSKIRTSEMISAIAPLLPNPVNLNDPDWLILIEIVADLVGISRTEPQYIFSTKIAHDVVANQPENWFLD